MTQSNKKCIAVIPVRGGSKGIPRKNARLLRGKPLLSYVIVTAQTAGCFHRIFVSTDDPELEEIGRRFGAAVIERPAALAEDDTTLTEVITHAHKYCLNKKLNYDYLATIQATCPLLTAQTMQSVVNRCENEDVDTVLTAVNEPHLAWGRRGGEIEPLYSARLNRQELPAHFRETGGIVVASEKQIAKGSRFGESVGVVEVSKEEAIDIDDYFDWWLAEKALSRKDIIFHVHGNAEVGLGHVYRTLTLADRLPDHNVSFLTNSRSHLATEIIRERHHSVMEVEPGAEVEHLTDRSVDVVINDVLDTSTDYMEALGERGIVTVNFEDQGEGAGCANFLINAMYDEPADTNHACAYHGAEYICLRDEFYTLAPADPSPEVGNVLILFGGSDPNNLTLRYLKWVDKIQGSWSITVIIGPGYGPKQDLQRTISKCDHHVELVHDTKVVSRHMKKADIAVTSAGRTVFELAALGIPMAVVAHNERETHHVFATQSPGALYLGQESEVRESRFLDKITQLISSDVLRELMRQSLLNARVTEGVEEVIRIIEKATQWADQAD